MWTAREERQVISKPYLLLDRLPITTLKGPKQSNPTLVKMRINALWRSLGRFAMRGGLGNERWSLHGSHFARVHRIALRPWGR